MARFSPGWGAEESRRRSLLPIAATFFLALSLEFLPWPGWALRFKPLFPEVALVYWAIHRPQIVNYAVAVPLGVLMDLAGQLPLGFTALSYSVVVFLANRMRGRFSLLGPFGQALHVLVMLCCGQSVLLLLRVWEGGDWSQLGEQLGWRLFTPSAVAAMLWFFLPPLMRRLSAMARRDE